MKANEQALPHRMPLMSVPVLPVAAGIAVLDQAVSVQPPTPSPLPSPVPASELPPALVGACAGSSHAALMSIVQGFGCRTHREVRPSRA